ncbi:MAG TPA: phytanoyl-CoA dioxygenase family protein [Verrucomicrobiae bacterium]
MEAESQQSPTNGFGQLESDGFQIIKSWATEAECDQLAAELTPLFQQQLAASKNRIGGVRNLLQANPLVSAFAKSTKLASLLPQSTTMSFFPVRAIFFDKTPEANWLVPWHQDLAIALEERIETAGFTGWSVKDGILHVHPPEEVLANMITMRLHLDDCDETKGALKVIAGSHRAGKIPSTEIAHWTATEKPIICEVPKGGVLLMRPLLLHASAPAENPGNRRVLHIEFASQTLPNGLKWLDN